MEPQPPRNRCESAFYTGRDAFIDADNVVSSPLLSHSSSLTRELSEINYTWSPPKAKSVSRSVSNTEHDLYRSNAKAIDALDSSLARQERSTRD